MLRCSESCSTNPPFPATPVTRSGSQRPPEPSCTWSNHGRYRPFPPGIARESEGESRETFKIDLGELGSLDVAASAEPELGWLMGAHEQLSSRLGVWGLAFLEALLISADREVSGEDEV